jgi:hypothetical protein
VDRAQVVAERKEEANVSAKESLKKDRRCHGRYRTMIKQRCGEGPSMKGKCRRSRKLMVKVG